MLELGARSMSATRNSQSKAELRLTVIGGGPMQHSHGEPERRYHAPEPVAQISAAFSAEALAHFGRRLSLGTDCADIHEAMIPARDLPLDLVPLDAPGMPAPMCPGR